MPKAKKQRLSLTGFIIRTGICGCVLAMFAVGTYLLGLAQSLPDVSNLDPAPKSGEVVLLDRHGRVIARRGEVSADALNADNLPAHLVDAVLAVEDRRFYSHFGVDVLGTTRALWSNIRAGRVVQGGSTITQQLAKNLFLSPERTYKRKFQEMMLALWLEQTFTKDEILALYLNRVYFGAGAWGAEAASRRYFGKDAHSLAIGEAALLAGLLKAPSRYAPTSDSARASIRATVVLDLMLATGRISSSERRQAAEIPIRVSRGTSSTGAGWFADWILPQVRELSKGYEGDLIVRTTLDVNAQRSAEAALNLGLSTPDWARGATQGAVISLDASGGVVAMVGGRDYQTSPFNRAVSALRQPGSAFKPFVYATAFEGGLTPNDVFDDRPIQYGNWAPENYGERYYGEITLGEAFAKSSNSVAVQVAEVTGRSWVLKTARRLGIESPMQNTHAVALGAYEVTPIELAQAYVPFMNGGLSSPVYAITEIQARSGEILYEHRHTQRQKLIADRVLYDMDGLFANSVEFGTSRFAQVPGRNIRGKTGTTNDHRDAWFAGWAGGLTAVVWIGNDDFSPTEKTVGGIGPARIFSRYIQAAPIYPADLDAIIALRAQRDPIASLIFDDNPSSSHGALNTAETAREPSPERDGLSTPQTDQTDTDLIASLLGELGSETQ